MRLTIALLCVPLIAQAECTVGEVLERIRPGSEWLCHGNTYSGLVWRSTSTTKPTAGAFATAKTACDKAKSQRDVERTQARAIVKDKSKTTAERLDALITIFGMDQ